MATPTAAEIEARVKALEASAVDSFKHDPWLRGLILVLVVVEIAKIFF